MNPFDDAMERRAVVEAGLGQFLEILDRLGRDVGPELGHHFAFARLDYRHFFFVRFIHWGRFLFFSSLRSGVAPMANPIMQQSNDQFHG